MRGLISTFVGAYEGKFVVNKGIGSLYKSLDRKSRKIEKKSSLRPVVEPSPLAPERTRITLDTCISNALFTTHFRSEEFSQDPDF